MKKYIFLFAGLVSLLFIQTNCTKDKTAFQPPFITAECPDTVKFTKTVLPIFTQNCATSGCHNAASAANGKVYETYDQIFALVDLAVKSMKGENQLMPLGGPALPDSTIQKVVCWVNQGKLNN